MASSATASPASRPSGARRAAANDPILRNALRYTISAREYAALHKYVLSRSRTIKKRAPTVETVTRIMNGDGPSPARTTPVSKDAKGKTKEVEGLIRAPGRAASAVGADDFNARAVRHSVRVFVATGVAMKLWTSVMRRLSGKTPE